MNLLELIVLAVGLSMDAFAVSVCKAVAIKNINYNKCIKISLYFGIFQALMPLIGYVFGNIFANIIIKIDHWITFGLLSIIGINMIKDSFYEEKTNDLVDFKNMSLLALATSIDALAVGITFSLLKLNIINIIIVIGLITTILTFIGTIIGKRLGNKINKKAKIIGGFILILIGLKILIEHLT